MALVTRMRKRPTNSRVPSDEKELAKVAEVMYFKVFNRSNDQKDFAFLAQVTEKILPDDWKKNRNSALIAVLRIAVDKLPDDEFPEKFDKSWRYIGEVLYGYRADLEPRLDGNPHTYDSRYQLIKSYYDKSRGERSPAKTFQRNVAEVIRTTLVEILKELAEEADKLSIPAVSTAVFPEQIAPVVQEKTPAETKAEVTDVDHKPSLTSPVTKLIPIPLQPPGSPPSTPLPTPPDGTKSNALLKTLISGPIIRILATAAAVAVGSIVIAKISFDGSSLPGQFVALEAVPASITAYDGSYKAAFSLDKKAPPRAIARNTIVTQ